MFEKVMQNLFKKLLHKKKHLDLFSKYDSVTLCNVTIEYYCYEMFDCDCHMDNYSNKYPKIKFYECWFNNMGHRIEI